MSHFRVHGSTALSSWGGLAHGFKPRTALRHPDGETPRHGSAAGWTGALPRGGPDGDAGGFAGCAAPPGDNSRSYCPDMRVLTVKMNRTRHYPRRHLVVPPEVTASYPGILPSREIAGQRLS
ncbi:hypothetical protein NIIDMKKI_28450 [Mycobacterium kansasii]|uniref:Uncharacterized protein n=1 Tax=Mycobacterium kansasii TaxID=1768 RepID=A0A7G1IDL4_MYCKA|nr:hypothetical protein NIIDMKKI_28450 [Mycobacterium kansasii]